VLESNRDLVLRRLLECLGRDRTRHQVAEVTSLGLVQMTRKRVGEGLLESFSETCKTCGGSGVVLTIDPVADRRPPKPVKPAKPPKKVAAELESNGAEPAAPAEESAAKSGRKRRTSAKPVQAAATNGAEPAEAATESAVDEPTEPVGASS
jgi:Ribonuclease G/E